MWPEITILKGSTKYGINNPVHVVSVVQLKCRNREISADQTTEVLSFSLHFRCFRLSFVKNDLRIEYFCHLVSWYFCIYAFQLDDWNHMNRILETEDFFQPKILLLVKIIFAEYATISWVTRAFEYLSTVVTHYTFFMPTQIHK